MIVREVGRDEHSLWDELVDSSPQGTIFHKSFWLNANSEFFNQKLRIIGCFEGDSLLGGCSFFVRTSRGVFETATATCTLTPYGGFVIAPFNSDTKKSQGQWIRYEEVMRSLCSAISAERFDHIKLVNSPGFIDIRPLTWNGWQDQVFYTYSLDLASHDEANASKSMKYNLRKASANNLAIKQVLDASLFYELFSMTFERQNIKPPVQEEYFKKMFDLLRDQNSCGMWIVETPEGEKACAHNIVWDNKRAYAWTAGSNTELRSVRANVMLEWEIIKQFKERGFKEYNMFMGNLPQLTTYATNFNPQLAPYYGVEKSSPRYNLLLRTSIALQSIKKHKQ